MERLLQASSIPIDLDRLHMLVSLNHYLLASVGTSHQSIEDIRSTALRLSSLATKITGAGGGGCCITFLGDLKLQTPCKVDDLQTQIQALSPSFRPFCTSLGGYGASTLFSDSPSEWIEWKSSSVYESPIPAVVDQHFSR